MAETNLPLTGSEAKKPKGSLPAQRFLSIMFILVFIFFFGVLFVLAVVGWFIFVSPVTQEATLVEPGSGGLVTLNYSVCYPRWLSTAEDDVLSLTLINTEPVSKSNVVAYVTFHGNTPIAHGKAGSNVAEFGTLMAGARRTQAIDLRLDRWTTSPMTATLWVSLNGAPAENLTALTFRETPIPQVKTAIRGLMGIMTIALGSGLVWLLNSAVKAISPE